MSCCVCNTDENVELVELLLPTGKKVSTWYCQKHLAYLRPCTEQHVQKCCGVPTRNGRCQITGKLFDDC